jgi:hypothetical protein
MLDLARALSSAVDAELDSSVAALSSHGAKPGHAGRRRARLLRAGAPAGQQPARMAGRVPGRPGRRHPVPHQRTVRRTGARAGRPDQPAQTLSLHRPMAGRIARGKGGRAAVPVRIPVTDSHGRNYVLSAVLRPDRILRVIERQRAPADSVIAVMPMPTETSWRARSTRNASSPSHHRRAAGTDAQERPGRRRPTYTLEGDAVATAYSSMSRYGWTVVVNTPAGHPARRLHRGHRRVRGRHRAVAGGVHRPGVLAGRTHRARLQRCAAGRGGAGHRPAGHGAARASANWAAWAARSKPPAASATATSRNARACWPRWKTPCRQARQAGQAKDEFLAVLGPRTAQSAQPHRRLARPDGHARRTGRAARTGHHAPPGEPPEAPGGRFARRLAHRLRQAAAGPAPARPGDTVRHAVAALPGHAVTLDAPAAVWVDGDDSRLAQVLNNLLSNAARFGSTATSVSLRAERTPAWRC